MDALILNIETSTKVCSVSLGLNGKLVAFKEESSDKYIHSEKLNLFIQQIFEETDFNLKNLNAICVSKGPGSYTGLRIGVSSAKGLCYALNIPLISTDSLSVLANGYLITNKLEENTILMPMIDARRMEVYTAQFDTKGNQKTPTVATILDQQFFDDKNAVLIGDGAEKCNEIITNSNIIIKHYLSSSKGMTKPSFEKFLAEDFEDVAYFEPFYLKDFVAG